VEIASKRLSRHLKLGQSLRLIPDLAGREANVNLASICAWISKGRQVYVEELFRPRERRMRDVSRAGRRTRSSASIID
jgi:hypothetical protein